MERWQCRQREQLEQGQGHHMKGSVGSLAGLESPEWREGGENARKIRERLGKAVASFEY